MTVDGTNQPHRVSVSFRIDATTAADVREFVRRQRGEPLFLDLGSFVNDAIQHHIERTEGEVKRYWTQRVQRESKKR